MDILVKEIDVYKNKRKKELFEYIIYLLVGKIPIEAYIVIGSENKNKKIKEIESNYKINYHQIIKKIN